MTIKELAYSAQQQLQASTGSSFKRAHIYELLAASFGFNSYAALGADTVFTQQGPADKNITPNNANLQGLPHLCQTELPRGESRSD